MSQSAFTRARWRGTGDARELLGRRQLFSPGRGPCHKRPSTARQTAPTALRCVSRLLLQVAIRAIGARRITARRYGSSGQRRRTLPRALSGSLLCSFPENLRLRGKLVQHAHPGQGVYRDGAGVIGIAASLSQMAKSHHTSRNVLRRILLDCLGKHVIRRHRRSSS